MLPPRSEVANNALAHFGCSGFVGIENCLIQSHWEQHCLAPLPFFLECCGDFILNPFAADGVGRHYQQQLVVQANGLVEAVPYLFAYLHIFRREPAPHTFGLQVCIEPFGKVPVFTGVADEAGIELDDLPDQRPHVGDEFIRYASASQEGFGDSTL